MRIQDQLLAEVEAFLASHVGVSATAFGVLAVNDGKLVPRLRAGQNMTAATMERTRQFLEDHRERKPIVRRIAKSSEVLDAD